MHQPQTASGADLASRNVPNPREANVEDFATKTPAENPPARRLNADHAEPRDAREVRDAKLGGGSGVSAVIDDELLTAKEIVALLKIGLTKWWEGVKGGIYPQPIYLGNRCTRWSRNAIQQLMERGIR